MLLICEYITYIFIIIFYLYLIFGYGDQFLPSGQSRHWSGAIQNSNGEIKVWDTLTELSGFSGNPMYWINLSHLYL